MYSLIIIEDEFIIRNALVNDINWSALSCKVAGDTDNGDKAIEMIGRLKPDIILSDIKIYGKSGIEVCKYIHENIPSTKAVLLTGYGDIEYAKAAIKYGVNDFILKPSNPEEIMESIKKLISDIDLIREKEKELMGLHETVQNQIPFYFKYFSNIADSVAAGNSNGVHENFNFISRSLLKSDFLGINYYKSIMTGLIVTIQTKLEDKNINIEDVLKSDILSGILECQCIEDTNIFVQKIINQLIKYMSSTNKRYSGAVMSKIENYLNQNYEKNIMLEDLGKVVYMNPKYVCRLIKKETGENFTELLNKIRINKAKELMKNIKYKTYEISDMVGIGNPRYFSQMFKKYTGMTPSEYRNKKCSM